MLGNGVLAAQRRGEHEANLALLHNVRGTIPLTRFRTCVRDKTHSKCRSVEVGRLARVAHVELHVVGTLEGQKIRTGKMGCGG